MQIFQSRQVLTEIISWVSPYLTRFCSFAFLLLNTFPYTPKASMVLEIDGTTDASIIS